MGIHAQHRQLVVVLRGVVALAALSCTGMAPIPPAPDPDRAVVAPREPDITLPLSVEFDPIALSDTVSEQIVASSGATVMGTRVAATWRPLLREGQVVDGVTFGQLLNEVGEPLARGPLCGHADFGGLLTSHDALFHVAHIECVPGAIWVSRLDQAADGSLTPVATRPVDLSVVHGGMHFCAGDITPWGTLLSAEEYDVDARYVLPSGAFRAGYANLDYDPAWMGAYYQQPDRLPYVYDHGWVDEVRILDAEGATSIDKHFAMGRFSHEIGLVLPDQRTVYLSDDGVNGGLFLFVADRAGDLSSGALYAARWQQEATDGGGRATLRWVPLGASSDGVVAQALRAGALHFDELFDHVEPLDGRCAESFTSINDTGGHQCLRVRDGADLRVLSRVETRRFAAMQGATTELRKAEGISYDPDHDMVYVALAKIDLGMEAGEVSWDTGGPDHVRLPENRCGGVYALPLAGGVSDTAGAPIDSAFVATRMDGLWMGQPGAERGCAADELANPDNIAYLPGSGVLMVAEDSQNHPNNLLWAYDVGAAHRGEAARATPVMAVPPGAEVTGIHWFENVGGFGYLTTTVQHPWEKMPQEAEKSVEDRMGTFGTFGPFPPLVARQD